MSSVILGQEGEGEGRSISLRYQFNAAEFQAHGLGDGALAQLSADGQVLVESSRRRLDDHPEQVALAISYPLPREATEIVLLATVLEQLARGHRQLIYADNARGGESAVPVAILDQRHPTLSVALASLGEPLEHGVGYWVLDGARHIWGGFDHLAFLGVLLLPPLVRLRRGERRVTAMSVVRLVTAFSIAHSVTLVLAAGGVVTLPDALVESSIALSVIVAALVNMHRHAAAPGLALAFGFGLLHGFGFAGALGETGVEGAGLLLSLLAFNVGVELGQLVIVIGVFALAMVPWVRLGLPVDRESWRRPAMAVGSAAIAVLASGWLVERISPLIGV